MVLTEWNEFRAVSLEALKAKMRGNVLADLRNIYRASHAREAGLHYVSIGRPATVPDADEFSRGLGRAAEADIGTGDATNGNSGRVRAAGQGAPA